MVTNHASSYPVQFWLQWLRQDHGYTPCQVMIDNSDAEIAGIKTAFAWRENIVKKVKVIARGSTAPTATERKAYRDDVLRQMIAILVSQTSDVFEEACREFEECNGVADDVWDGSALVVYFNREYLGKKDKWSLAWREVSP
ncbi:hypothetical protein BC941DRAFT_442467 [Chlamydoabsidia padenii]|nr:hypothetical protein BC941DRAFT_442467 [Chlamydoabsidia padenii]